MLEKKGRGLVLTPIGAAGLEGLSLPFRQITDTVDHMRMMSNSERLIVSVSPSFAASWLVPRLEGFKTKNPGIDVLIDSTIQLVEVAHGAAAGTHALPGKVPANQPGGARDYTTRLMDRRVAQSRKPYFEISRHDGR